MLQTAPQGSTYSFTGKLFTKMVGGGRQSCLSWQSFWPFIFEGGVVSESRKGIYFVENRDIQLSQGGLTELNYPFSSGILNSILGKEPEIYRRALTPHESISDNFVATGCTYISNNFFPKHKSGVIRTRLDYIAGSGVMTSTTCPQLLLVWA